MALHFIQKSAILYISHGNFVVVERRKTYVKEASDFGDLF